MPPKVMVTCQSCLSLVLCLCVLALPGRCCRDKEYLARDGECCPMCHEGTVVRRDCTALLGTGCSRCDSETFMNRPNGLNKCFPCSTCVSAHGLFAQQSCTATTDTVCEVLSGHYCRSLANNTGCSMAEKHSGCAPGQRVKEPGTSRTDTVCEDCRPGYFSQDGVTCLAWTICSDSEVKVKEGSRSEDVVCSGAARSHSFLFTVLVLFVRITCLC